jgi:phage-related minor tail protein
MKLSELKEQIKQLHLQEATKEEVELQKELNKELEKTKELSSTMENKVTKSQFEAFLREEILETLNEQEEDENVELGDLEGEEEITSTIEEPAQDKALELDDIGDTLVKLARRAKDVDERELANQILNSAKFAKKTEFKKVEKDAGIGDEQV